MNASRAGRGWLLLGSVGLLLVMAAHVAGHLQGGPPDPAFQAAWAGMEAYRLDMGLGTRPSLADTWNAISLGLAAAIGGLGFLFLLVWRRAPDNLLRPAALVGALTVGALAATHAAPPVGVPLLCYGVIAITFLVAALRAGPTD